MTSPVTGGGTTSTLPPPGQNTHASGHASQGQYIRCLQIKMSIYKKYDNMMIMNPLVSDPSGGNGHGPDSEAILANHCLAEDPNCADTTSITMDPLNIPSSDFEAS